MEKHDSTRMAHCDACGKDVPSLFDPGTGFIPGRWVASLHPNQEEAGPVGSCTSCDADICHRCAKWDHLSEEELALSMGVTGSTQQRAELRAVVHYASCPKCGQRLQGKTKVDWDRLKAWFASLREDRRKAAPQALRMLRICREEEPIFRKQYEGQRYQELVRLLESLAEFTG